MAKIHGYGAQTELLEAINVSRFLPGTREQKVAWLAARGHQMSLPKYDKALAYIKSNTVARLNWIAHQEYADAYLQSIDRAKDTVALLQSKMRDARATNKDIAMLGRTCVEWEKHLTKLYDADAVVAHMVEKANHLESPPETQ